MATIIAPLASLKINISYSIDESISIERTPPHVFNILNEAKAKGIYRHPIQYNHCLIIRNFDDSDETKSREILERIVTLMRIYKPGNIFYSGGIIDSSDWYANPELGKTVTIFGIFFFVGWEHPGTELVYEIAGPEFDDLAHFVHTYKNSPILNEQPFKLYFKGYHEPYTFDKFLDNAIGLESLLVNDGDRSNFKYKFSDRGTFLLRRASNNIMDAEVICKNLSDIYDLRSVLVHNRKTKVPNEQLLNHFKNADYYLRMMLKYVLANPSFIDSRYLDAEKRRLY